MAAKTAVEVAEMESELYLLRQEKQQNETRIALLTQERDALKIELAIASARAREEMIKAAQLETIVSQTSLGLVAALRSYHTQRIAEQSARRAAQERELGVGGEDSPTFLARRQAEREAADELENERHPLAELQERTRSPEPRRSQPMPPPREQRRPEPSEARMRDAAEVIGRAVRPAPRTLAADHPLLPRIHEIDADESNLRDMMQDRVNRG